MEKNQLTISELSDKRNLYDKYQKKITNLIEIQSIIFVFLNILKIERKKLFINFKDLNFEKLLKSLINSTKDNSEDFLKLKKIINE